MMNSRGFTLIEVIVVIAIIAIISVLAVAVTSQTLQKSEVAIQTTHLKDTFRVAQSRSISGYQDGVWGVRMTASSYTLFRGAIYAGRDADYDEIHTFPQGMSASGLTDVIFEIRTGTTDNVGTITLTHSTTGDTRTITVNAQGRITDL